MNLPCLRCGTTYEQTRRQASHFCPDCRLIRKRQRDRDRQRELSALRRDIEAEADAYLAENDYLAELDESEPSRRHIDDYVATLDGSDAGLVVDRMPAGANSPAGPDDGCSTGWTDLAEWLDQRAADIADHPWFAANPHWSYALHDEQEARLYPLVERSTSQVA